MTYKEKLIEFIRAKNSLIYKNLNIYYIKTEDVIEIKNWSEKDCKKVYNTIKNYINNYESKGYYDTLTCPWCIYYHIKKYTTCYECKYGKRHGICNKNNSLYDKLSKNNQNKLFNKHKYKEVIDKIEDSGNSNDLQRKNS